MPDPAPPARRRAGRVVLLFLLAFVVVGGILLAALSLRAFDRAAKQVTLDPGGGETSEYALTGAQQDAVAAYGPPDAFTLLFYRDENAENTRQETWSWFERGHEITFTNGDVTGEHDLPPSGGVFAAPYRPEQFLAYMSLDEVLAAASLAEYMVVPLEEDLVPGGDSYFADQLTFGMKDGALLYVESVAFEDLEAAAATPAVEEPAVAEPQPTAAPTASPAAELPTAPIVFISERADPDFPACMESDQGCASDLYILEPGSGAVRALTADVGYDSSPDWSPDGSRVAFGSRQNGNWDIYVINADGSGRVRLTTDESIDSSPSWSPDGTQIVFYSSRTNRLDLYIINADGTGLRQLTNFPGIERAPAWSPDGSQIVFHSSRDDADPGGCWSSGIGEGGCNFDLYTIRPDGTGLRRLTDTPLSEQWPVWSPDGTQIVYDVETAESGQVYVVNADGSDAHRVTPETLIAWRPDWSPDGEWIVFAGGDTWLTNVMALNVGDGEIVTLTGHDAMDNVPDWQP